MWNPTNSLSLTPCNLSISPPPVREEQSTLLFPFGPHHPSHHYNNTKRGELTPYPIAHVGKRYHKLLFCVSSSLGKVQWKTKEICLNLRGMEFLFRSSDAHLYHVNLRQLSTFTKIITFIFLFLRSFVYLICKILLYKYIDKEL